MLWRAVKSHISSGLLRGKLSIAPFLICKQGHLNQIIKMHEKKMLLYSSNEYHFKLFPEIIPDKSSQIFSLLVYEYIKYFVSQ